MGDSVSVHLELERVWRVRELGDLEAAVMDRLWTWERPATVREILEALQLDRKLAYTTVMTVLDNLHRKRVVARESNGRAYLYTPVQGRADYRAELIATVLADTEDRTVPLLRFVERLTPEETHRLRAALEASGPLDETAPGGRRGGKR